MHWSLWIIIGIVAALAFTYLGFFIYFRLFGKKVEKASDAIVKILDEDGLLDDFKQNKPYEEIKDKYCKFIDHILIYQQYMHFISLQNEREWERQTDCVILQYKIIDDKKVARFHFHSFPMSTLLEKVTKPKEMIIDGVKRVEELLYNEKDVAYVEFNTHNQIFSEKLIKTIIDRYDLKLDFEFNNKPGSSFLPQIYSEWLMAHRIEDPKPKEVYEKLRKINQALNIKLYRKGEM